MNTQRLHILLSIVAALPALAKAESSATPFEAGSSLFQVILSLVVVVLLLLGTLYLLKRLSAPRGAGAGLLRVVAATAVGTRERVVVVEVGETWLVLGVAPGSVSALHQLPRRDAPNDKPVSPGGLDFAGWLKQVTERRHAR
ncbi:MAG: flagellar biosynthetic protein FliO [Betaproteobacteria bacterium]|nr:flagellar biosynthetic protein FliO [Betaproteobacteria bacterium]